MNIEEKIRDGFSDYNRLVFEDTGRDDIKELENYIVSICQQEIKSACDKQKEICAKTYLRYYPIIGIPNSLASEIKTAPYPEGVEGVKKWKRK